MRSSHVLWRFFLPIFLIVAFSSCCVFKIPMHGFWEKKVDVEPISRVVMTYANKMRVEKSLRFEDSQVFYSDRADVIRIIFSTQLILELKEARELVVDLVEGLLAELNKDSIVTSQFQEGIVRPENIELYISFESYFAEYIDQMYMSWVSMYEGVVRFYSAMLKDFRKDFWCDRAEPYYKSRQSVIYDREARASYDAANPPRKEQLPVYDALVE
ncbi:hypothetical protein PHSC3_000860 [Chlamydiales bacterium STE3]|nr:hypothetical protein PHSC3_000860 [Chlamydiales bacterium STE3]